MSTRSRRVAQTLAIIILVLAALYVVLLMNSTRALRNAYRALEQDGRPMRAEQIIPPQVPDAENGALLFQAAALRLKAEPCLGETNLLSRLSDLSSALLYGSIEKPDRDELQLRLAQEPAPTCLQMVRDGIERPACRFPLDYTKGYGMLLPHLSDMRAFSRILGAQALLQAEAGDPNAAWDTAILNLRLGQKLEKEPTLISQLLRIAQLRIALNTIRKLAVQTLPSDAQTAAIDVLLPRCDDRTPLILALDSERLLAADLIFSQPTKEMAQLLFDNSKYTWPVFAWLRYSPFKNRDHAAFITILHRITQQAGTPYAQATHAPDKSIYRDVPRYCLLTRLMTPAEDGTKLRLFVLSAEGRITQAGLAVLRRQRAMGAWPDSLDAADTGAILDPFTGQPLRYKKTDTGAVLYSVGANLKDDGGSDEKDDDSQPLDIVWRL